jgi:CheY-like chemotaxis protein
MTDSPLAGRRVLILEDRYLIASELTDLVEQLGAVPVGPFASVAPALTALADAQVEVALLDVNLNGEPVFPVAELLATRGVPFIFLTGYDEATLPAQWRGRPRLAKPVDPRLLRAELAKLALSAA